MAPSTFLVPPLKFTDAKKHMELSLQVQLTPTTNMEICVAEPKDTPRVMSCFNQQCSVSRCYHNIATTARAPQVPYQLVFKSKYDCTGMLCCITNYWNQDDANEADRQFP